MPPGGVVEGSVVGVVATVGAAGAGGVATGAAGSGLTGVTGTAGAAGDVSVIGSFDCGSLLSIMSYGVITDVTVGVTDGFSMSSPAPRAAFATAF